MEFNKHDTQRISTTITWLRFPLIFFIILLHSYSVVRLECAYTYFKVIYPFSLWIGETGVPGFFFISGFLFFLSKKGYKEKLKTRFHSLFIPYILWNAILLAAYFIAYAVGYPQDINGKNIANYGIADYFRIFWDRGSYDNGNFVPLLCPLWYIRNLLIMSIFSPLLYYIIRYIREFFLLALAIWWMTTYDNAFIPQTVLFFSLGSFFSILQINPLEVFLKYRFAFLLLFMIMGLCDIATHTLWGTFINLQIHRLALVFNIPALFLIADYCVRHGLTNKQLSNTAFIVFCVHYPIVIVLRKTCVAVFPDASDIFHILLYFVCVMMTTIISLFIYFVLYRYFPKFKKVLSGNR